MKIGTLADWFKVGVIKGIEESEKCGASGVQLYAWNELNPMKITNQEIKEIRRVANDCGQTVTALCGELSELRELDHGRGLEIASANPTRIEYLKRTIDLSKELDCDIVTTHIGVIPDDESVDRYKIMQEACAKVAEYAEKQDVWIAIETGPEKIETLCRFEDEIPGGRIVINYDPANLIMVTNVDEVAGVKIAGKRIVHTHAKDGVMHRYWGPEPVYLAFAEGGAEAFEKIADCFEEKPLGQGSVHWKEYLTALHETGFDGYLTIEREVGKNPGADIRMAVEFLKNALEELHF